MSAATGNPKYFDWYVQNFLPGGEIVSYWAHNTGLKNPGQIPSEGQHHYRSMTMSRGMLLMYDKVRNPKLLESTEGMAKSLRGGGGSVPGVSGYAEHSIPTQSGRSSVKIPMGGGAGAFEVGEAAAGGRHTGETCANAYLPLLGHKRKEISLAEGNTDAWWMDAAERTILNALFCGQSADGRRIRYGTEFEGIRYWSHLDSFCCPNSYRRGIAYLPGLIFSSTSNTVTLHLYAPNSATFELAGGPVTIKQETAYPADGKITIAVEPEKTSEFTVQLRIPAWADGATAKVNGEVIAVTPGQYASIKRTWTKGDKLTLNLPMSVKWVEGTHEQQGRAALLYGPMTFTFNPMQPGNKIPGYKEPDYDQRVITHEQDRPSYSRNIYSKGFPDWEPCYELLRQIVIDPDSVGQPEPDSARPGGLAVKAKAQLPGVDGWREITLTDFPDEGGRTMHFLLSKKPANLVRDPVFSPRAGESLLAQIPSYRKQAKPTKTEKGKR